MPFAVVLTVGVLLAIRTGSRPPAALLAAAGAPVAAALAAAAASEAPRIAVEPVGLLLIGGLAAIGVAALGGEDARRLDAALAFLPLLLGLPLLFEFGRNVAALGRAGQGLQLEGWVRNSNVLAVAAAATVPFAVGYERVGSARAVPRALAAASTVLGVVAVVLSGSRTGLLALAAAGLVGFGALPRPARRLALAGAATAAALLVAFAGPRLVAALDPAYVTNVQRARMAENAAAAVAERPILGWGPGAAPFVYPRFQTAEKWELHYHSLPLQVAVEGGAVGLVAWTVTAVVLGAAAWRARCGAAAPAAASLAAIGVANLTDYLLWIPLVAGLFWIAAGRVVSEAWPREAMGGRQARAWTAAALFALLAVVPPWPTAATHGAAWNPLDAGATNIAAGRALLAGETAAAEAAYRAALAADPWASFGPHHLDLARLLAAEGRAAEARPLLEAAAGRYPNLVRYFVEEVLDEAARAAIGPVAYAEVDPAWTQDLLYGTVDLYPSPRAPEARSLEEAELAVLGDPHHWRLRRALGARLLEAGLDRRAYEELLRAEYLRRRQAGPNPHLLDLLARAAGRLGEAEAARRWREAADAADRAVWPYAAVAALAYNRPWLRGRDLRVGAWPHPGLRPRGR